MPKGIRVKAQNKEKIGAKEIAEYGALLPENSSIVSIVGKAQTKKGKAALGAVVSEFMEVMRRPNQTAMSPQLKSALGQNFSKVLAQHQKAAKGLPKNKAHIKMEQEMFKKIMTKLSASMPTAKHKTEVKKMGEQFGKFAQDQEHGSFIRLYSKFRSTDPSMVGNPVIHYGIATGGGHAPTNPKQTGLAAGVVSGTMVKGMPRPGSKQAKQMEAQLKEDANYYKGKGGQFGVGGGASRMGQAESRVSHTRGIIKPRPETPETAAEKQKTTSKAASRAASKAKKASKPTPKKSAMAPRSGKKAVIGKQAAALQQQTRSAKEKTQKLKEQIAKKAKKAPARLSKATKPSKATSPKKETKATPKTTKKPKSPKK